MSNVFVDEIMTSDFFKSIKENFGAVLDQEIKNKIEIPNEATVYLNNDKEGNIIMSGEMKDISKVINKKLLKIENIQYLESKFEDKSILKIGTKDGITEILYSQNDVNVTFNTLVEKYRENFSNIYDNNKILITQAISSEKYRVYKLDKVKEIALGKGFDLETNNDWDYFLIANGELNKFSSLLGKEYGRFDSKEKDFVILSTDEATHFLSEYADIEDVLLPFTGNENNNIIYGTHKSNILKGEGGDDTIYGWGQDKNEYGDEDKGDTIYGGFGSDTIYGGKGNDIIYTANSKNGNIDTGTTNTVYGGAGSDTIYGEAGDDTLYGYSEDGSDDGGKDTIYGRAGNDTLYGGDNSNQSVTEKLYGGEGDDTLVGGAGKDYLDGGKGFDTYKFLSSENNVLDYIKDEDGEAQILIDEEIIGKNIRWDKTKGEYIDDKGIIYSYDDSVGNLKIKYNGGKSEINVLNFNNKNLGINLPIDINLTDYKDTYNDDTGKLEFNGKEETKELANSNSHIIKGLKGDDTIYGGKGLDTIYGNEGEDNLYSFQDNSFFSSIFNTMNSNGNSHSSKLIGGAGDDHLYGGKNFDTYEVSRTEGKQHDIIEDLGGNGLLKIDGIAVGKLKYVTAVKGVLYYESSDKKIHAKWYKHSEDKSFELWYGPRQGVTIKNFKNGEYGIELYKESFSIRNLLDKARIEMPPISMDPIILDLDKDGTEISTLKEGAHFDLNADGFEEKAAWVGEDDGLLVLDRNGDGKINDGRELFGDATILQDGKIAESGFQALSEYDQNSDRKIDKADNIYSELKVWQDKNRNGKVEEGELKSLEELEIESLGLNYEDVNKDEKGSIKSRKADYIKKDGTGSEIKVDDFKKGDLGINFEDYSI